MPSELVNLPEGISGISVMVACYNEAPTLRQAVEEALAALEVVPGDHEVVIIDDGSDDGSGKIADDLAAEHAVVDVVHHQRNLGLGGFYRTSFWRARKDVVYFMAADLQPIPAEYFPVYLPLFETHDGVVGFDLEREAPALSKLLSWGEKVLFEVMYPGVPKVGGPLMIRRSTLRRELPALTMDDGDRGWIVLWELMIRTKRSGARWARVPVRRRPRARGATRGSTLRTAWLMLRRLGALRRRLARDRPMSR